MLTFIKVLLVVVVCSGATCSARRLPYIDPRKATIIRQTTDPWRPDGYKFAFETSFGTSRSENGYLKTTPNGRQVIVTEGEFSYFGTDRKFYQVNYIADENGYRPFLSGTPETRTALFPSTVYEDDADDVLFPDDEDELNKIFSTTTISTVKPPKATSSTSSSDGAIPSVPFSTSPTIIDAATPDVTAPTTVSNGTGIDDASLDDRFGLPPGLVGSLLGG